MTSNSIGMSVPGAELFGANGGSLLAEQEAEERKKRIREAQQQRDLPGASAPARSLGLLPGGSVLAMATSYGRGL